MTEPYRVLFPTAFAAGAALFAVWGVQLAGGPGVLTVAEHGRIGLFSVLGSAVMGFALTAYPRQNGAASPPWWRVGVLAALQLGGVFVPAVAVLAWTWFVVEMAAIGLPSLARKFDPQPAIVLLGAAGGLAGVAVAPSDLAVRLGVFGCLLPIALGFLDRVVPFFSSRAIPGYDGVRRPAFLPLLAVALAVRAAGVELAGVAAAALIAWAAVGWRPSRVPMLAVLHLGAAWVIVGLALDPIASLGTRPLHAVLLGGLGTWLLGIGIRVTSGHAGRPIRLGTAGAVAVALLQVAVLFRVLGPVGSWPVAAAAFAAACLTWVVAFGPLVAVTPSGERPWTSPGSSTRSSSPSASRP